MKRILKILVKFEEGLIVFTLIFMVLLTFINVVMRKFFPSIAFSFSEELAVILFVWISMLGAAICYKKGSHLGLSLITDRLPYNVQKWISLFGTLCSAILLIVIIYIGWEVVQNQLHYGQKTPALGISEAVGGTAIPVGGIIILIRAIEAGVTNFKTLSAKGKENLL